jgi:hypothetical protein
LRGIFVFDFPTHFLLIVKGFRTFVEMWKKISISIYIFYPVPCPF